MRTLDPSALNFVANDPKVRPWLKGEGVVDLTDLISNPSNIALQYEGGGWVLQNIGGCVYEVHSLFLPEVRGKKVREYLTHALIYTFIETDAVKLVTRLPKGNLPARALAAVAGFRKWFMRGDDEYAVLHIEDWIQSSYACLQAGQKFHERLEAVKRDHGSPLENHAGDESHDRAVGASMLMCRAGNPAKGIWHYNQWANLARVPAATLTDTVPTMISIAGIVLHGSSLEVIPCR